MNPLIFMFIFDALIGTASFVLMYFLTSNSNVSLATFGLVFGLLTRDTFLKGYWGV